MAHPEEVLAGLGLSVPEVLAYYRTGGRSEFGTSARERGRCASKVRTSKKDVPTNLRLGTKIYISSEKGGRATSKTEDRRRRQLM